MTKEHLQKQFNSLSSLNKAKAREIAERSATFKANFPNNKSYYSAIGRIIADEIEAERKLLRRMKSRNKAYIQERKACFMAITDPKEYQKLRKKKAKR